MTLHSFGDIPDAISTKRTWPLFKHIWSLYRELGFEYVFTLFRDLNDALYPEIYHRMTNSIQTCQALQNGEIREKDSNAVVAWFLMPPVMPIRADLTQGAMKLIFGESTDVTFVILDDEEGELFFLINGHCEDGIPVDWWLIKSDDELFDRRHIKRGIKLRDAYKKMKSSEKAGKVAIEILRDIRNERTPEFSNSNYTIVITWGSCMSNACTERSNYENAGVPWDSLNYKKYGLPDSFFTFYPPVSILETMARSSRGEFMTKFNGILAHNNFISMELSDFIIDYLKTKMPVAWSKAVLPYVEDLGVPIPRSSMSCLPPRIKDKDEQKSGKLDFNYPVNERIRPPDLNLSSEEFLKGLHMKVDNQTHISEVGPDKILSRGIGADSLINR